MSEPYKWTTHRHLAEMKQELQCLGSKAKVYFTPHLVPVNRGILTTAHILLNEPMEQKEVEKLYQDYLQGMSISSGTRNLSSQRSGEATSAISWWRAKACGWLQYPQLTIS